MTETFQERRERAKSAKSLTTELRNSDPKEYARVRDAAGVVPGGYRATKGITVKHYAEIDKPFDSPTLLKMAKFPKETCARWYKGQLTTEDVEFFNAVVPPNEETKDKLPSVARLRSEAPNVFNDLEAAALAHKVIFGLRRPATQPEAKPGDDGRVPLGDKLGAVVGLPGSYRVTPSEYIDVQQFANQVEAARAK